MLSRDDATALVLASPLFDELWYADLVLERFADRAEAVAHWVAAPGAGPDEASPHPLFEPAWLYPGGRWRRHAPDPLSFYLSQDADRRGPRSPHPRYPQAELGPLERWLVDHDPAELLPEEAEREHGAVTVRLGTRRLGELVAWVRHLTHTAPEVVVDLDHLEGATARVVRSVAADLPRVHVDPASWSTSWGKAEVTIDDDVAVPRWRWLPALLDVLERSEAGAVQPVLVGDDQTLTAPALAGHPVSALDRLDLTPLPERVPGVEARRDGVDGPRVLTTAAWVPGPAHVVRALDAVARAVPDGGLRWAIDVAAPAAPLGRRWGDWHFARSLADALERRGQWVEIDHPETRGRTTRAETDVVLTLRGLERVEPHPGAVNLLWVISHPDEVSDDELAGFDVAYAASTSWAASHGVEPLLQCTDATRFRPDLTVGEPDGPVRFVGNARGGPRPAVAAAREAGVPLAVVGSGWAEHGVEVAAESIDNADLPAAYASAGVVLTDHHADMAREGFVSNRVFDVLAVGGRLLTDPVAGLDTLAPLADLPVWRSPDDVARLAVAPWAAWPGADERRALAERVVREHSFDARAATLLNAARSATRRLRGRS
ncbi:glycosyltransferase [Nocardioides sp. C4-1]|uniref:glycosyltransferase family protein n=1 Tax=Nocardioides sp. C4-1 TaxID=3151851 RepID=UPI00326674BA